MMHLKTFCTVLLLVVATLSLTYADPWPDYSPHTDLALFAGVLAVNTSGSSWDYTLTISQGVYESEHGGLAGIKALVVYPNGGDPEQILGGWSGDDVQVRANWDNNGGWHTQQGAFGYMTNSPAYYITAGQSNEFIGTARFPADYTPSIHAFLVHVACNDGYTYWARPSIVPEPGQAATCVAGAIPFLSLARKRRR